MTERPCSYPARVPRLFFTDYSLPLAGMRDGKWKLIAKLNSTRAQLFDLEADPEERFNSLRGIS
jgi:arylsulfatase A-like enzyme